MLSKELFFSLLLLPITIAAPLPNTWIAPVKRAIDIPGATTADPHSYIVSMKENTVDPHARGEWLNDVLSTHGHHRRDLSSEDLTLGWNETVFNGLAGTFSDKELCTLSKQPEVKYIQQDILLHTTAVISQTNAPWGLSRVSTAGTPLPDGSDPGALTFTYSFDESGGAGVDIYVLDTGVRTTHGDFGGRATFLQTFAGTAGVDLNGHGTHVSGTIIGGVFGVAKSANVRMLKCMDDSGAGTTTNIVSAINSAASAAISTGRPSIVSMSIGGAGNEVIDDAVINSVNLGIPFIVAAGNEGVDASNTSPARLGGPAGNTGVVTVGATNVSDQMASFSNFGTNVDILAPGQDILSDGFDSDSAVQNLSGTSMSTPHVSGLAALIMGQEGKISPTALKQKLVSQSAFGVISGVPIGSSNTLANNDAAL